MTDTHIRQMSDGASHMSTAALIRQGSEQLSRLVRDEMQLARAELREKGKRAGAGIGLFSAAGITALYGVGAVLAAAVLLLALVLPGWAAALIVGGALLAIAGVMALIGRLQLRKATPHLDAIDSAKADAQLLRERVRQ
ncbi:MAG: phage holin family protein [Micromonosporaceae bacterium]